MKHIIYILLFFSCAASANPSLTEQLNALDNAQNQIISNQNARARSEYNAQLAEQRRLENIAIQERNADRRLQEKAIQAKEATNRAAAARAKDSANRAAAQANAVNEERLKDKARAQSQEDEDHALELEVKRARVQEIKAIAAAKAARANELIDADLAERKANTDVIQSGADATRNVSEGAKQLQIGVGKGAEAKGGNWFGE